MLIKKLLRTAALCALLPAAAQAQPAPATASSQPAAQAAPAAPAPDADPALWVVKDDDTTIYLFGTFHMLDGQRDWFNDEVKTAFDASDELVLEAKLPANPADLQPMILRYAVDQSGRTLSSRLTPEQNETLNAALASLGAPPGAFDRLEPWFVAMTLAVAGIQKLGISGEHGPETILSAAAAARNMPIGELEGMEAQIRMLDGMPEPVQVQQLTMTLEQYEEIAEMLRPMLEAWSTGDVDRLVDMLNQGMEETPELYRIIFSNRNQAWADWIRQRMAQPGTVFMAVGAGHLAGRDSVQDYLTRAGLDATRVPAPAAAR